MVVDNGDFFFLVFINIVIYIIDVNDLFIDLKFLGFILYFIFFLLYFNVKKYC